MASDRAPEASAPLNGSELDTASADRRKELAARAAAELVCDGMKVGLGTGTTVAHLLSALGERATELSHAGFVATSPATERIARELGLGVCELDELVGNGGELDIAIDGADQIDPDAWLIKGGGGAHTREKIVAAAARRFVVIVSTDKLVASLRPPVPLEVLPFGAHRTLAALGDARLRDGPASPDGNLLAFYDGPIEDPRALAARLSDTPGVVEHGLFAPELVSEVLIGAEDGTQRRPGGKPAE
jgi:ribose 5-phosphate isomerase A